MLGRRLEWAEALVSALSVGGRLIPAAQPVAAR